MFDPPDYPYKDLAETLRDTSDDFLFNNECTILTSITNVGDTSRSYHENDSGRYFINTPLPIDNVSKSDKDRSAELLVIRSENLFNYEPTLLDDNTVNEFLVPLQNTSGDKQDDDDKVPDLLALQSCVLCHEIFTSEADLLDHTISVHATNDDINQEQTVLSSPSTIDNRFLNLGLTDAGCSNVGDFATEWLVCSTCERVLSTAVEDEVTEPLCCNNSVGSGRVNKRKLDTMYVCDFCNGLFADAGSLDRHKSCCCTDTDNTYKYNAENAPNLSPGSAQYPEIYFHCEICQKRFHSAEELKSHSIVCQTPKTLRSERHAHINNSSSKMWNCGSCNQLFATARELYRHKRGEDRPEGAPLTAYVCEECDKVLGSMCALHTHRKMHKVTKPGYPCRICGRRFNQSGHLAIHMRMHTGERPYPCDLCSKAFKVKVERDDHRRTHTGERPFACTACPKTFTAAARLREHARIHTDQRPYRCEICGAAFRRPYARTVHTLIHTGEKPHECDICGTAFSFTKMAEDVIAGSSSGFEYANKGKSILRDQYFL